MRDYLASNRLWRGEADIATGLPPDTAAKLLLVHPELLDTAFAAIDEAYGSFDRYADLQLGLDAARRALLREQLIE